MKKVFFAVLLCLFAGMRTVAANTPSGGTWLYPSTTAQSHGPYELDADNHYDFFRVSMTVGRTYTFETTGNGDTYGELFSSASTDTSYRVVYDDDGGDSCNFKLSYTPTASGTYYLRVRAYTVGVSLSYTLKYVVTMSSSDGTFTDGLGVGDRGHLSVNGRTWTYTVLSDGTAMLTGVSPATGAITIPVTLGGRPVTSIGRYAFSGCGGLTSVTIPSGVTNVERRAFASCANLTLVAIPASVKTMGEGVFGGCARLKNISLASGSSTLKMMDGMLLSKDGTCLYAATVDGDVRIPSGVERIGEGAFEMRKVTSAKISGEVTAIGDCAFRGCCSLKSLTLSEGLRHVGAGAFGNCTTLESVTIPSTVEEFGDGEAWCWGVFEDCRSLKSVTIRKGVSEIADYSFNGCISLTSVTIPSSVKSIGWSAFENCRSLKNVTISEGVEEIASAAFRGCSALKTVTIPSSALVGGEYWYDGEYCLYYNGDAFANCSALERIAVSAGNPWHKSVNGLLLSKDGTTLIAGVNGAVTIPEGVEVVESKAFAGRTGLTSVTIPSTALVGCDGEHGLYYNGDAFVNCSALKRIAVAAGNPWHKSVNGLLLSTDGTTLIAGVNGAVTIPEGVEVVEREAFAGRTGLTSVTIPSTALVGGEYWYDGEHGLYYNGDAFVNCSALKRIAVAAGNPWHKSVNGLLLSKDGTTLIAGVNGAVTIPEGVEVVEMEAFVGRTGLTSVTIPTSVEDIGYYDVDDDGDAASPFAGCTALRSILVRAGNQNYYSQNGLLMKRDDRGGVVVAGVNGDVVIPEGVIGIDAGAFYGLSNLKSVTIPSSVERIGFSGSYRGIFGAFTGCTNLSKVVFRGNAPHCGDDWDDRELSCMCSAFPDITKSCAAVVEKGSTGWDVSIPGIWHGMQIRYSTSSDNDVDGGGLGSESLSDGSGTVKVNGKTWTYEILDDGTAMVTGVSPATGAISIPSSLNGRRVTAIGEEAFEECTKMTSVTIPASVETIGDEAFKDCWKLTSVAIPANVMFIGEEVFKECDTLRAISVAADNPVYKSENGLLLSKDGQTLFEGVNGAVRIPDGVEMIVESAFVGRRNLTSVSIPASVTEVGVSAFENCNSLKSITVDPANEVFKSVDGLLLSKDGWTLVEGVNGAIRIPDGVETIRESAFNERVNLTSVTIPASVTFIGEEAFKDCISLKSVMLPAGMEMVGECAFEDCDSLKSVTFLGNAPECVDWWGDDAWGEALPRNCTVYVLRGSTGWGVSIPGTWHGHKIRYAAANSVGVVMFAKAAVSVRESAAYVDVTVNRTAKTGRVRVKYATEDGSAEGGEDFKHVEGVLEWADGDKSAKKVRVPLIPDLVPVYDGVPSKTFTVRLEPLDEEELDVGEQPADIDSPDVCTVTITETSKEGITPESVYAKKAAKRATVKTEDVPLWSGSFHGFLANICQPLYTESARCFAGMCDVTVSKGTTPTISVKVKVAGKTYSFSGKGWDGCDACGPDASIVGHRTFTRTWKQNGATYEAYLEIAFDDAYAWTSDDGAWQWAGAYVVFGMGARDANGDSMDDDGICLQGSVFRDNSKVQDYLDIAHKFAGYYTVALSPRDAEIGNGYLTLTIDNKGKAKVTGLLADGTTRPSTSAPSCHVVADDSSANGWSMYVGICHSTAKACLGGILRLYAVEDDSNPDGSGIRIVVDSGFDMTEEFQSLYGYYDDFYDYDDDVDYTIQFGSLRWFDDSETGCVSLYGTLNNIPLSPCGGWYDKVINLQRHYLDYALSVETMSEFPSEVLPDGYDYEWDASPSGFGLALSGDKVTHDKRKIVKTNKLTNFDLSVNPCNVNVKLARATGLVTGGFSLWAKDWEGTKQKEITGFKTYGVLLLARDPDAPLGDSVIAPGFVTKMIKKTTGDDNGRKKTFTWPFSAPFNVVGE